MYTLREADALIIWKLGRIGRSLAHVVDLLGALQKLGVGLKVPKGGISPNRMRFQLTG